MPRLGGATAEDVNAKTTMLVIGAEGLRLATAGDAGDTPAAGDHGDDIRSVKLRKAEELNAEHGAGIRILSEDEFCRLAGVPSPETLKRQYHATRDLLVRYRALRDDHLRYLVKCGLIRPVLRTNADTFFAFTDLAVIKQANDELERGMSFRSVVRTLTATRHGQLAFDFRLDAAPAKIIALRKKPADPAPRPAGRGRNHGSRRGARGATTSSSGSELDDGDEANLEGAAAAYRKALELDPYLVAASSTSPISTTAGTSWSRRRRSTSARSASSQISSRRTSTSATSTTTSIASPRPRPATARRCGSTRSTPTRISTSR